MPSEALRAARIAGPMLRGKRATAEEVEAALRKAQIGTLALVEWTNEARRRNGGKGLEELRGADYRAILRARAKHEAWMRAQRRKRKNYVPPPEPPSLTRLQRIARRITRLFRKH